MKTEGAKGASVKFSLRERPTKKITIILLIAGLAVAVPAYTVIQYYVWRSGMNVSEYGRVWASFKEEAVIAFHMDLIQHGDFEAYRIGHRVDYIFQIGFLLTLFSLALLLARALKKETGWKRACLRLPFIGLAIPVFDFLETTLVNLTIDQSPLKIPSWVVEWHSVLIIIMTVLIYAYFLWTIILVIMLIIQKIAARKARPATPGA